MACSGAGLRHNLARTIATPGARSSPDRQRITRPVAPTFFAPVDEDFLTGRRPFLRLLHEAAQTLGGRLEAEPRFAHILRYWDASGQSCLIAGAALGLNDSAAARIAEDKDYTARLLASEGLPTPPGVLVTAPRFAQTLGLRDASAASRLPSSAAALRFAQDTSGPLFAKPNTGSEGADVHRVENADDLAPILDDLLTRHTHLRVEQAVPGQDARLLVLDGVVRAAYRRRPLSVTGDGQRSLEMLLTERLHDLAQTRRGAKVQHDDPRIDAELTRQGKSRSDIPPKGQTVALMAQANHATGGTVEDLTSRLPPQTEALALHAAKHLGLRLAGVDILAPDLIGTAKGATILEVNSSPGLGGYASAGPSQWANARDILIAALKG